MPAYDRTWFDPPAPLARVTVRNPDIGTAMSDVPMLLDSGADVTLLPAEVVQALGVIFVPGRQYDLVGFDGSTSLTSVVRLDLNFGGRTFRGQYVLIDQVWGVLGWNVLNAVVLLFDEPNLI